MKVNSPVSIRLIRWWWRRRWWRRRGITGPAAVPSLLTSYSSSSSTNCYCCFPAPFGVDNVVVVVVVVVVAEEVVVQANDVEDCLLKLPQCPDCFSAAENSLTADPSVGAPVILFNDDTAVVDWARFTDRSSATTVDDEEPMTLAAATDGGCSFFPVGGVDAAAACWWCWTCTAGATVVTECTQHVWWCDSQSLCWQNELQYCAVLHPLHVSCAFRPQFQQLCVHTRHVTYTTKGSLSKKKKK